MTVELNEVALAALLDSERGPVGLLTAAATDLVKSRAVENAKFIMHSTPVSMDALVGSEVSVGALGVEGVVGVAESGQSIADYLEAKAIREKGSGTPGDWLAGAARSLEELGWTVNE